MSDLVHAQTWDPERYAANARFVADLGLPVLDLLAPRAGERILDLGCGDGALTEKLAGLGCAVVGADASTEQIRAAQARGLQAFALDGQELAFVDEFDAVFSNAALHWMPRTGDVFAGVWRGLKSGGRFVAECGGEGNIEKVRAALHAACRRRGRDPWAIDPWRFLAPAECERLLVERGFEVLSMALFARPTPLPGDITGWLATFAESFTASLPEGERPAFVQEVREALQPELCDDAGRWTADYVRLRFAARKPAARSRSDPRWP